MLPGQEALKQSLTSPTVLSSGPCLQKLGAELTAIQPADALLIKATGKVVGSDQPPAALLNISRPTLTLPVHLEFHYIVRLELGGRDRGGGIL